MNIKYMHTNINARDWRKLSQFYKDVFGCVSLGPKRDLHGEWFEKVTGITGAAVEGEHIALPGYSEGGPTFEIFTYTTPSGENPVGISGYGFAHVAFQVDDVDAVYERFRTAGGSTFGEKVVKYYETLDQTLTVIYAKDPEGNAVEIMNWKHGNCEEL